jgi:hypothetical protein
MVGLDNLKLTAHVHNSKLLCFMKLNIENIKPIRIPILLTGKCVSNEQFNLSYVRDFK